MSKTFTERARCLVAFAAVALSAATASAQPAKPHDEEGVRLVFTEGLRLRDQEHDPEAALKQLKAAHELAVTARTAYELGKTYLMLGRLVEAAPLFEEVNALPPDPAQSAAGKQARDDSKKLAAELQQRIPSLTIRLTGDAASRAEVRVDDTPVSPDLLARPRRVNPGTHTVSVRVAGEPDRTRTVTLAERQTETVIVDLGSSRKPADGASQPEAPHPATTPASSIWTTGRTIAVVTAAAGVVAVGVGGVLALSAKSSFDDARKNQCGAAIGASDDAQCSPDGVSARQSAGSRADVATVLSIAGVVAVAGGVVLWLVSPPGGGSSATGVGLGVASGGVVARGRF